MNEWAVSAVNDGCKVHFDAGAALLRAERLRPRFISCRAIIRAILGQQSCIVLDEAKILFDFSNDAPTLKMALDYVRSKMSDQGQTREFLLRAWNRSLRNNNDGATSEVGMLRRTRLILETFRHYHDDNTNMTFAKRLSLESLS